MSSGAIRFTSDENFLIGEVVRLSIQWPATLSDGTSLSLYVAGRIQWASARELEVVMERHEFRTRRGDASTPSVRVQAMARRAG